MQERGSHLCVFLTNPWHCDDRITVNCGKDLLSSKGDSILYHLVEFAGKKRKYTSLPSF